MKPNDRWPPLMALVIAAVMVFLVLPNPLRIPQNNPTASAEYAPVPGNEETDENANFSTTSAATSAGLGSGGEVGPGGAGLPPLQQFKPRHKNCVGNPPRQTEDPLSPPCVPFFDGDNGGNTWRGVTKNEITVVYYNDFGVRGDLTQPWKPADEQHYAQPSYYYQWHVRTVKAQLRYFQERYQTYGRRVKMIGYRSRAGLGTPGAQRQAEGLSMMAAHDPFSVAVLIENAQTFAPVLAERKVPVFGWNEDVPLDVYTDNAPYFWSFMPDQLTESRYAASFICRKLRGRTAKFTDDPDLRGRTRTFGLIWPDRTQRGPFLDQLATLLRAEVKRQCNMTFDYVQQFVNDGDTQAATIMARMKSDKITTVICYCIPQQTELTVPKMQNAATSIGYFPEWYWDHATAMDRALWQRNYGAPQHKGFGVSYLWRLPQFTQSYPYQAYLVQEPGTQPNLRFNFEIYHVFLNLFQAIQAAGPNLTPDNVERGMFTFHYLNKADPWIPTGSYGPAGPSPYTFIESGMAWWWDPAGTPPGGKPGEGCVRVMYEGRRFAEGEWPEGDEDMFDPSDPCTEDERRETQ